MQTNVCWIDNLKLMSHHIRPDISKPRIAIVTCQSGDTKSCLIMPFAPGIPELYDRFVASSIKHHISLNSWGNTGLHGLYTLWRVSNAMVEDVATELKLPQDESNPYPFLRVVMEGSASRDKKSENTEDFCFNCESKNFPKTDGKTTGWNIQENVQVEMGLATDTTVENVRENDVKANRENNDVNKNHPEIDDGINIDTASEGQTMKEPALGRDGDMMMDIAEKVVDVVEMCMGVKKVMRREKKQRAEEMNEMQEIKQKEAMKDKMKGNMVDENNACRQFKTSETSKINPIDCAPSAFRHFNTPMDDSGPTLESLPTHCGQNKIKPDRNNEADMQTVPLVDSRSEQEPGIQHTICVGEDVLMAVTKLMLDAGERLRAKKRMAVAEPKQTENDDKTKMEENTNKISHIFFSPFSKSHPDGAPEYQDGSGLRLKSMASPQTNNWCSRPVQYKNDMASNSTTEQDQFTEGRTNSTIWTPGESSLCSY
jgi:hypothetical protein